MLIRPILDYGAIAYDSTSKSSKKRLDTIQYKALRICCSSMVGTSGIAMQNECGELPLHLRRKMYLLQYGAKIKTTINHPSKEILEDHWTVHYGKFKPNQELFITKVSQFFQNTTYDIKNSNFTLKPPWKDRRLNTDKSCSVVNKKDAPEIIKPLAQMHIEMNRDKIQVYTDASKSACGKVSAAYYIQEFHQSYSVRLINNTSVYSAELSAIQLALNWIAENVTEIRDRIIYTDSMSTIQSLESRNESAKSIVILKIYWTG